ncbi:hypothetical protein DMUE_2725 [Dictyocoela muelleri]|nr:hypothetical protein DMUE_2725 [Dictyocoela muelleri]
MNNINLDFLMNLRQNISNRINFLRQKGILRVIAYCSGCNDILKEGSYKRNSDKVAWRCYKKSCSEFKKYESIRKYSFFEDMNISLSDCLSIFYYFATGKSQNDLIADFNIKQSTVSKLKSKLREKISKNCLKTRLNTVVPELYAK